MQDVVRAVAQVVIDVDVVTIHAAWIVVVRVELYVASAVDREIYKSGSRKFYEI